MNCKTPGLLLCLILCSAASAGTLQVKVYAALGPDPYAPSYWDWTDNVNSQVRFNSGASSVPGIDTDPTGYTNIAGGSISHGDMISTYAVFPSWRGDTPGVGAFAGEYGGYLYFPFSVVGLDGEQVSLPDIRVVATSNNAYGPANYLGDSYDYNGADYAQDFFGVTNGIPTLIGTSGDTPVDAVYYTGYGVAFYLDPTYPNQADLPGWLSYTERAAWLLGNFTLNVCVYAETDTASGSNCASVGVSDPNSVPEPGTWVLLGLGLAGLGGLRRYRKP